jgi:hypothetical protein
MTDPQCLAGSSGWGRWLAAGCAINRGRNMPVDCQTYLSCQAVTNLRIFLVAQEIQANFAGAKSKRLVLAVLLSSMFKVQGSKLPSPDLEL